MKFILFLGITFFLFSCDDVHETVFPKKKKEIDRLKTQIDLFEEQIDRLDKRRERECKKEIVKEVGESVDIKEFKKHGNTIVAFIGEEKIITCIFDSEPKLEKPQPIN